MFKNLPIELFATDNGYYVFDAKNVLFLEVDGATFAILNILRERGQDIEHLVTLIPQYHENEIRESYTGILGLQERGYLVPSPFRREIKYDRSQFEHVLSTSMSGFTIYVTTQCNLACSYCIYGGEYGRYHELSRTTMSWETAKNMLDFLIERSQLSRTLKLDFFGGEPLLAFDLIKRCIHYLKSCIGSRETGIEVTIASNGTIITGEILDFLLEHKVYLQFSIDGCKEIHDSKRQFKNNSRGSYDIIIKNLERIYDRDPAYFEKYIRIKSVISMDTLDSGSGPFSAHPLIEGMSRNGHLSAVTEETHYDPAEDSDFFEQIHRIGQKLLARRGIGTLSELISHLNAREQLFYNSEFAEFYEVQAVNKVYFGPSDESIPFKKGCLMGCAEGAVDPSGDIFICHKATSFVIGNVNEGRWYLDKIWDLYYRLHEEWPECSSCFVQRFCDLCFEKLNGNGGGWTGSRRNFCDFTRKKYSLIFDYMLRILDQNPDLWDDIDQMVNRKIQGKIEELKSDP